MLLVDALASAGIERGRPARVYRPGHTGGHRAQGAAIASGAQLLAAPAMWISCRPALLVNELASAGIERGRPARVYRPGHTGGHRAQGTAIAPGTAAASGAVNVDLLQADC